MKHYTGNSLKNKNGSAANEISPIKHVDAARAQFADSRHGALAQRDLQRIANDSPQTKQLKALKNVMCNATEKAIVQRTGKDAYHYLKSQHPQYDTMGEKTISAKSLPFYLNDLRSPLNQGEKIEFLKQYNLNLPEGQQVKVDDLVNPLSQEEPKPKFTEEEELNRTWTPGKFGKGSLNAVAHYEKHVLVQGEFSRRFNSVIEYVRAAKAFWREGGGISTTQGRKGLVVKFDQGSGKYTLSVDDGGLIATFFEVQNIGGRGAPIEQIVALTGMDKVTVQELISRLTAEPKDNRFMLPRQQDGEHMEDEQLVEIDGMLMNAWDADEYMDYKRKVDF